MYLIFLNIVYDLINIMGYSKIEEFVIWRHPYLTTTATSPQQLTISSVPKALKRVSAVFISLTIAPKNVGHVTVII